MQPEKKKRVVIADDHDIVCSGLELLISQQLDLELVASAGTYEALRNVLDRESDIDLLILDLNLGDRNGLSAVRDIKKAFASLPILVLSMYPEEMYALQTIKAGASGYLNKRAISGELIGAIRSVLAGKNYISETVENELLYGTSIETQTKKVDELLSEREFQVLSLLSAGKSASEIAQTLSISPKTVSTYRARMLEKLSLENTAQLIQYALQNNIVA